MTTKSRAKTNSKIAVSMNDVAKSSNKNNIDPTPWCEPVQPWDDAIADIIQKDIADDVLDPSAWFNTHKEDDDYLKRLADRGLETLASASLVELPIEERTRLGVKFRNICGAYQLVSYVLKEAERHELERAKRDGDEADGFILFAPDYLNVLLESVAYYVEQTSSRKVRTVRGKIETGTGQKIATNAAITKKLIKSDAKDEIIKHHARKHTASIGENNIARRILEAVNADLEAMGLGKMGQSAIYKRMIDPKRGILE